MLSILSRVALPLMESLCASKAVALRLTEGVRAGLNAQNTLVTVVMPGAVDTDMSKDFPPPKMAPEEVAEAVLAAIKECCERCVGMTMDWMVCELIKSFTLYYKGVMLK